MLKENIRWLKEEIGLLSKPNFLPGVNSKAKSLSLNMPADILTGYYDPYLTPSQSQRLKNVSRKTVEAADEFERQKNAFILRHVFQIPKLSGPVPTTISQLIEYIGSRRFVKAGSTLSAAESKFVETHKAELKEVKEKILSLQQKLLRAVSKR